MSANRIKYEGLEELKAALRAMPDEFRGEGGHLVVDAAKKAAGEIRAKYQAHRDSGNLADGVEVEEISAAGGKYFVGARVRSTSPIASIFENGSEVRKTKAGYPRGRMPPANIFVSTVLPERRSMYGLLKDMLRRKGLLVRG